MTKMNNNELKPKILDKKIKKLITDLLYMNQTLNQIKKDYDLKYQEPQKKK